MPVSERPAHQPDAACHWRETLPFAGRVAGPGVVEQQTTISVLVEYSRKPCAVILHCAGSSRTSV